MKITSCVFSIVVAGSVIGCAAEADPTGTDLPPDTDGSGSDPNPGDPPPPPPPPTSCTTAPDSCSGDNVCVAGACVTAFGRVYQLVIESGSVPEKDANSAAWDPFGGLPDPYVSVFLNDATTFSTAFKSDTIAPLWHQSTTVTVGAGSKLQLDVYDDDLDLDGYMFSCFDIALGADVLRKHGGAETASCQGSAAGSTLRFFFVPQ